MDKCDLGAAMAELFEMPTVLGWRDTVPCLVPRDAVLWIVTHQTTGG